MDVLRVVLGTRPKTKKMLLHIIGVILYSRSAFQWEEGSILRYNELMRPLHNAAAKDKMAWNDDLQNNLTELSKLITTAVVWLGCGSVR